MTHHLEIIAEMYTKSEKGECALLAVDKSLQGVSTHAFIQCLINGLNRPSIPILMFHMTAAYPRWAGRYTLALQSCCVVSAERRGGEKRRKEEWREEKRGGDGRGGDGRGIVKVGECNSLTTAHAMPWLL